MAPMFVVLLVLVVVDAGFVVKVSGVAIVPEPSDSPFDAFEASAADADARAADSDDLEASMTNCGSSSIDVMAVVVPHLNMDRTGVPVQR
jgi:hypothetical protein